MYDIKIKKLQAIKNLDAISLAQDIHNYDWIKRIIKNHLSSRISTVLKNAPGGENLDEILKEKVSRQWIIYRYIKISLSKIRVC